MGANPLTAGLGLLNIGLYSLVYTPMKVRSEWNTWVGSLVGAIPPVMGYTAATGLLWTPEAFLLGASLFVWQFPHFFALSWRLRKDYARGGFQMVAVNDKSGVRTADLVWKYSLLLAPIPVIASATGVCSWMFAVEGLFLNGYAIHLARVFKNEVTAANSHKIFMTSLWYLPVLLSLMVFHKVDDEDREPAPAIEGDGFRESMTDVADAAVPTTVIGADGAVTTATVAAATESPEYDPRDGTLPELGGIVDSVRKTIADIGGSACPHIQICTPTPEAAAAASADADATTAATASGAAFCPIPAKPKAAKVVVASDSVAAN